MKKILILNRSINQGGIDLVGQELAKYLNERYKTTLITFFLTEQISFKNEINIYNLNVPPSSNKIKKLTNLILRFWRFKKYLKKEKPDIVIAEGNIPNVIVGLNKKLGDNSKTFLTVHNTLSNDLKGFFGYIEKLALVLVSKNANVWVADTEFVGDDFKQMFKVNNVKIIPNPVSPFLSEERQFKRKFIFAAGRLVPQKDFATLIKAYSIVLKKYPTLDLIIAGEGEQLVQLKNLSKKLGINGNVKFIGFVKNLYPFLAESEFVISSSLYEGMPMVILQALQIGKAIVATQVPGTIAAVGNAGLFSPVGDEQKLAANIIVVLKDFKLRQSLEKEAKKRANFFSIEEVGKEWEKLIEGITL